MNKMHDKYILYLIQNKILDIWGIDQLFKLTSFRCRSVRESLPGLCKRRRAGELRGEGRTRRKETLRLESRANFLREGATFRRWCRHSSHFTADCVRRNPHLVPKEDRSCVSTISNWPRQVGRRGNKNYSLRSYPFFALVVLALDELFLVVALGVLNATALVALVAIIAFVAATWLCSNFCSSCHFNDFIHLGPSSAGKHRNQDSCRHHWRLDLYSPHGILSSRRQARQHTHQTHQRGPIRRLLGRLRLSDRR